MKPLITIITVTYRAAAVLDKTLDSISSQTLRKNVELLVIDGASDDGTLDIVRNRTGEIDRWVSEPDKGIYDAMNKGAFMAAGDYIIFMNAGDTFASADTLEKVLPHLDGSDFIYGDCFMVHQDGEKIYDPGLPAFRLPHRMICSHQSLFTRADSLKKLGFDLRFTICADYHQLARGFVQGCSFSYLPFPVGVVEIETYTWAQLKKGLEQKKKASAEVFGYWKTRPYYWIKSLSLAVRHGIKRLLGRSTLRKSWAEGTS